jgi:hypothetical protein
MSTCSQEPNRPLGRFEKGQSGNPGGRPPRRLPDGRSLTELAREKTEDALAALAAVLEDARSPAAARVAAATALLDRGWGRPAQTILSIEKELPAEHLPTIDAAVRIASILNAARARKMALPTALPDSES